MKKMKFSALAGLLSVAALAGCTGGGDHSGDSTGSGEIPTTITNGGFEEGNLSGWTRTGMAFSASDVTDADTVNGVTVNKEGTYFLNGNHSSLASARGTLRSPTFKLTGTGYVGFKIGAAKNTEKIYVQFFEEGNDTPLSFKANGEETAVIQVGNTAFNGVLITDNLVQSYVDLSAYLDKNIYMLVTDEDTANNAELDDYSYVNLDDVKVLATQAEVDAAIAQRAADLAAGQDNFEEDPSSLTLDNGGFETGNLEGWKVIEGRAFTAGGVIPSATQFWGNRSYQGVGNFVFSGESQAAMTGSMRSQKFTVDPAIEGNVYLSFRMGAAKRPNISVSIVDGETDQVLTTLDNSQYFTDPSFALNLIYRYVDVTEYKGRVLYFLITDNGGSSEDFNFVTLDDFKVNLTAEQLQADIDAIKKAESYTDDGVVNGQTYVDMYDSQFSFPFAGAAPVSTVAPDAQGAIYTAQTSRTPEYATSTLLSAVRPLIRDDYTAKSELTLAITAVTLPDQTRVTENLETVDMSAAGDYIFDIQATDAYQQTASFKAKVSVLDNLTDVLNGGFETGDLSGWTATEDSTLSDLPIESNATFWGENVPTNQGGEYMFTNGWRTGGEHSNEEWTYELKSATFTLSGSGFISWKMGGNSAVFNVYDAETDTLLASYQNRVFNDSSVWVSAGSRCGTMTTFYADLSEHLGRKLYVSIQDDNRTIMGGWRLGFFDDIVCYHEEAITGGFDTLVQPEADEATGEMVDVSTDIPWVAAENLLADAA